MTSGGFRLAESPPDPPRDEAELVARVDALAGETLGALAARFGRVVPPDFRRAKGWVGTLVEAALGADAGSRAVPDFEHLGIELKTLPIDRAGKPRETTFVCTIALTEVGDTEFEDSLLHHKLRRVLWVPVESEPDVPIAERRIGQGLLWSPSEEQLGDLRFDWDELAGLIGRGGVEAVTGHLGQWVQVRPKAANSRSRRRADDADGVPLAALPRGFYLRTQFTARILREHFDLP